MDEFGYEEEYEKLQNANKEVDSKIKEFIRPIVEKERNMAKKIAVASGAITSLSIFAMALVKAREKQPGGYKFPRKEQELFATEWKFTNAYRDILGLSSTRKTGKNSGIA